MFIWEAPYLPGTTPGDRYTDIYHQQIDRQIKSHYVLHISCHSLKQAPSLALTHKKCVVITIIILFGTELATLLLYIITLCQFLKHNESGFHLSPPPIMTSCKVPEETGGNHICWLMTTFSSTSSFFDFRWERQRGCHSSVFPWGHDR